MKLYHKKFKFLKKQRSREVITALALCCFSLVTHAQLTSEKELQNLSPFVREKLSGVDSNQISSFIINVKNPVSFLNFLSRQEFPFTIIKQYTPTNTFLIEAKWGEVIKQLFNNDDVIFIDEKREPKEELAVSSLDLSTNKVNVLHNEYPQWNGDSIVVSVKENIMDTTDIDFKGRFQSTNLSSPIYSSHASIMATLIAGGGNTFFQGKGAAWGATITSSNFSTLLPDADASYQEYNISVQNHSYGTGIENFYGADAAAYDASAINNPYLMHIFSAGNSGNLASTVGTYAGIQNYSNVTGSFKMAKNIITVGATDSFNNVAALSSKGPAFDGRVKPELVAFGQDGSSGAAAIVSGTSLLLQQAYKMQHNGLLPASALLKAILLNSADDVETKNIDYKSGYGSVNSYKAMKTLLAENYISGSVANGETQSFNFFIPEGIKLLKLTLAWSDPPAQANVPIALINDLDLELQLPSSSQSWKPWVLNKFPNPDSLALLPLRSRDSLNNVEQITIDYPATGNYIINVTGFDITSEPQEVFIAWQNDSSNTFKWYFPGKYDNIFSGDTSTLRWESNYSASNGLLEFSIDGINWAEINSSVDLTKGYLKWLSPDTFSTGILRMNIGSQYLYSDTFTISDPLNTFVGFNCTDSFMFYWNKIPNNTVYQLYHLGDKYMEPFATMSDTVAKFDKASNPSQYYAVAPLIKNKAGVRSYTFDYSTQGVGCFIKTFFAQLINGSSVMLDLVLGTTLEVNEIIWEKLTLSGYQPLGTIASLSGLQFSYIDESPAQGANTYRATIELNDGSLIYTEPQVVYYSNNSNYIIYPDPASQSEVINIISKEVSDAIMNVYNSSGELVMQKPLDDILVTIPAGKLSKGFYLLRITNHVGNNGSLKLIVY